MIAYRHAMPACSICSPSSEGNLSKPKVIVAQVGARRNYAVARMLHADGALAALYTDLCFHGIGARFSEGIAHIVSAGLAGRVQRRAVRGIPSALIYSAPDLNITSTLTRAESSETRNMQQNRLFSQRMIGWGTRNANVVYAMFGSGSAFWRYARARGLKIVVDVFITPMVHRIVAEERRAFPDWVADWEAHSPALQDMELDLFDAHVIEILETADLLVCPSDTVVEGISAFRQSVSPAKLTALARNNRPRAIIVPYGNTLEITGRNEVQSGHILFAGGADVRKGIHYLARAASLLKRRSADTLDFRIAGAASARVRNHPKAAGFNFLGLLSPAQMQREYRTADVFVLPTLAEGSSNAIYEALAAGVPVVTTRSAGSVITNGREGLIVPERDAEALAAAIERIVEDRELRAAMSKEARKTAAFFDEAHWQKRLISALCSLFEEPRREMYQ